MLDKELEKIVQEERGTKQRTADYVRNVLKEYLQAYLLYFIYTSPKYAKTLIFTGGTCLRHFYGLERLSEDLDFNAGDKHIDHKRLQEDLEVFFKIRYRYQDVNVSAPARGNQVVLKFPVLHRLKLAPPSQSDLLILKIDLSQDRSRHDNLLTSSKSLFGFNFAAKHYDLPDLMAGKLHAIFKRQRRMGKDDRESIKGRDYFDLLWFLKNGVRPNLERLSDKLGRQISLEGVEQWLDEKVAALVMKFKNDFETDLIPLLSHGAETAKYLLENYQEEYRRYKNRSFASEVFLDLVCQHCRKEFSSGIKVKRTGWERFNLKNNIHICPHCSFTNRTKKSDYILSNII